MAILGATSRALAVAVSKAIANDEVRELREALEAENLDLKAQLGRAPWREDLIGDKFRFRR